MTDQDRVIDFRPSVLKTATQLWRDQAQDQKRLLQVVEQARAYPLPPQSTLVGKALVSAPAVFDASVNQINAHVRILELVGDNLGMTSTLYAEREQDNVEKAKEVWGELGTVGQPYPNRPLEPGAKGEPVWDREMGCAAMNVPRAFSGDFKDEEMLLWVLRLGGLLDDTPRPILDSVNRFSLGMPLGKILELVDAKLVPLLHMGDAMVQIQQGIGSAYMSAVQNRFTLMSVWHGPAADHVAAYLQKLERWYADHLLPGFKAVGDKWTNYANAIHTIYSELLDALGTLYAALSTLHDKVVAYPPDTDWNTVKLHVLGDIVGVAVAKNNVLTFLLRAMRVFNLLSAVITAASTGSDPEVSLVVAAPVLA